VLVNVVSAILTSFNIFILEDITFTDLHARSLLLLAWYCDAFRLTADPNLEQNAHDSYIWMGSGIY